MDEAKKNLKGSESRDTFKQQHKLHAPSSFYACDLDFVLVIKYPSASIKAFLDYKRFSENITFSEVIAYNQLLKTAPIFIIRGNDPEHGAFYIQQYKGGDWHPNPPKTELIEVAKCPTWAELVEWERKLRQEH